MSVAAEGLRFLGAVVREIPASVESKMPDLLAAFGSCRVLIEEKDKHDRPVEAIRRREAFRRGEVYASSVVATPNNRVSGIIRAAAAQLASPATPAHDFRMVWYNALGPNASGKARQFYDTAYGRQVLWEEGRDQLLECYFFNESSFFTHRATIDGAICAEIQETSVACKLLLNPMSPRYEELLRAEVVRAFGEAVYDPRQLESVGECLVMDADVDRTSEVALLSALQVKYGLGRLMTFNLTHLSAEVAIR